MRVWAQSTYQTAERAACEGDDVPGERRGAHHHDAQAPAHALAHLAEHQLVPHRVAADYASEDIKTLSVLGSEGIHQGCGLTERNISICESHTFNTLSR